MPCTNAALSARDRPLPFRLVGRGDGTLVLVGELDVPYLLELRQLLAATWPTLGSHALSLEQVTFADAETAYELHQFATEAGNASRMCRLRFGRSGRSSDFRRS